MQYSTENSYEKRKKRVMDAIALKEPDRVPFAPKMGMIYCGVGKKIDLYEGMIDFRNMGKGIRTFLERYEVDLFRLPSAFPITAMEILGTNYINWPGVTNDLDLDSGIQMLDRAFLEEDEYDDFLRDPSHFMMTKIFPRRHDRLGALSKLTFNNIWDYGHFISMKTFSEPEVQKTLTTLMAAGEQVARWLEARKYLSEIALEMQAPLSNQGGQSAPYDMFADNVRGYLNVPMDLFTIPEKVEAAIELMEYYANQAVDALGARGDVDSCFMALHGGTDDFMSIETYRKYYWPSLHRVIERLVSLDITPFVFCEGKYDTRIETLAEVPKGKVVYQFEKVDMARAKNVLGDVACICGNIPGATLIYGKEEEVREETKRLIDICAPGGGFIMDCSMSLDTYNERNMDVWYETTLKYGKYK